MFIKILIGLVVLVIVISIWLLRSKSAFFAYYMNRDGVKIIRDIAYVDDNNPKHKLDLYLPKDKTNYPMVYFVHGGNWDGGDKNFYQWITGLYGNIGIVLAKQGIGVAVVNYRLYPQTNVEGMLEDVIQGVEYIMDHASEYGYNPKIYLMGHSAGGHLVTFLATQSKLDIAAVVALSPVLDVPAMTSKSEDDYKERIIYPLFGKTTGEQKKFSPSTYWSNIKVPVCVMVGEYDHGHVREMGVLLAQAKVFPEYSHTDLVVKIGSNNDLVTPEILKCVRVS